jgi:EmrB/QacA subfamily drug resistance transporter
MTDSLSTRQKAFATVGIMLTLLLVALDQTVVGTAMPRIIAELNGLSVYAWVTTAYLVASTVVIPVSGKLGDMFGRKPFMLVGMVGFMVGSWLSGFSQSMTELIAFRAIQGIFGGILFSTIFTVLADIFEPAQLVRVQGLFGAVFGLSSVIGPTVGGWITDNLSWRWVFYVNIPVGALAILTTVFFVPYVKSKASWKEIDFVGVVLLSVGVIPFLIGLSITNTHAWTSPEVLTLVIGGGVVLVAFGAYETRIARNPVVPFELFRRNQFAVMALMSFFTSIGLFGGVLFVPLLYQGVLSISATNSGNLLIPMTGGLVVFSTISGQLLPRIKYYRIIGVLGIAAMILATLLLTTVTPSTSQWTVAAYTVILGGGLGLTFPLSISVVQVALPQEVVGVATSQMQFWRNLGGVVGTAVLGSILANRLTTHIQSQVAALNLPPALLRGVPIGGSPQAILDPSNLAHIRAGLAPAARPVFDQVIHAIRVGLADAIHDVFLIGAAILIVAMVTSAFLKEVPIPRGRRPAPGIEVEPEARGPVQGNLRLAPGANADG